MERFPSYHCFRSQCIYHITIAVCSYEHGAEKILSLLSWTSANVSYTAMRAVYPYEHTLTKFMLTISYICEVLSIKMVVL